jgi:ADP-ribosylglycohydrolase
MVGGGPYGLAPGQWTDDTSMALCLAESLVERASFDPEDQLHRYCRWFREGYLSSTGKCVDIGNATRLALVRFESSGSLEASPDPSSAGNGSIMRLAPVAMAYARDPRKAIALAMASSRVTHGSVEAADACRYLAALLVGALRGASREELVGDHYAPVPRLWEEQPLAPRIAEVASGSFRRRQPPEIRGTGYVVPSLEAALWAFFRSRSFREGALLAVNLGDDADSTGAVYGQLAGAFYGEAGIPPEWRDRLARLDLIRALAGRLHDFAGRLAPSGTPDCPLSG